jgi:hypothetical protein
MNEPANQQQRSTDEQTGPGAADDSNFDDLRHRVLQAIGGAVLGATERVKRSQDQSTFRNSEDCNATLALVKLMPKILELLQAPVSSQPQQVAAVPGCFLCEAPPGKHWTHECPHIDPSTADQFVFDYRTRSIYERRFLGQPVLMLNQPIEESLTRWLEHNRLTREQRAEQVTARQIREQALECAERSQSALIVAQRCDDRNAQVAARMAGSIAADVLALLDRVPEPGTAPGPDPQPENLT